MSNIKTIITGIQPTNKITLGNYFGAIKPLINLQEKYHIYAFVADLHSITTIFDPKTLPNNIKNVILTYISAGIDQTKVKLFIQSEIPAHTELAHILLCHTTIGELKRMTQFKDKSSKLSASNGTEYIPTGLLIYPTLMAADILLYDSDYVATGSDQKQHIELARNIANRFNNKYGKTFNVPEPLIPERGSRIMDLLDPTIKMSKSNKNEKGTIFLLDSPEVSAKKIMSAKTDSLNKVNFDVKKQPGVSNLITIYSCLTNKKIEDIVRQFQDKNYGEFKKDLSALLKEFLIKFQNEFNKNSKNYSEISKTLDANTKKFNEIASKKINEVYKKVGFR
ncbi:MAG: tryptophan--tRNA ligase [Mycoplasmoidaceae bacterium]|nr:tryptophan--tRNA ligase [Mycoplasmoidaceae bacterium]